MRNEEQNGMRDLLKSESGRATLEYAVILSLVMMGCLTAVELVGFRGSTPFGQVSDVLGKTKSAAFSRDQSPGSPGPHLCRRRSP